MRRGPAGDRVFRNALQVYSVHVFRNTRTRHIEGIRRLGRAQKASRRTVLQIHQIRGMAQRYLFSVAQGESVVSSVAYVNSKSPPAPISLHKGALRRLHGYICMRQPVPQHGPVVLPVGMRCVFSSNVESRSSLVLHHARNCGQTCCSC